MIRYQNSGYKKNQFRKLETNKYKINESQRSIKVTESQLFLNNMESKASEDQKITKDGQKLKLIELGKTLMP